MKRLISSGMRGSLALGLALFSISAAGGLIEFDAERDVGLVVSVRPDTVAPGGSGRLAVRIVLPERVHITSRDMGFFYVRPDSSGAVEWGEAVYPAGEVFEGDTVFRGEVEVGVPFTVAREAPVGDSVRLSGTVGYQICTETPPEYCLPPVERTFSAGLGISRSPAGGLTIEQRAKRALGTGSLVALLWIFLSGVALSFTPCVYPVVPITIAYIGARAGGRRLKGLTLSLVFVLGLALVYSVLGLIAAATGGVFGISTQSPWILGFVTLVFLVMGAGMLGAFEITLPASLQTKISGGRRSGYLGALFVGGTTGLVAAPCVGPVLVALLSWVSTTGNLVLGFLYLFVFACGLGVLFVVIGTFAGALTALPAAGGWMETVKRVFGVVLIGAAFHFGKPLVSEELFILLLGLALLMLAGMLGAFSRLEPGAALGGKLIRGVALFVVLVGAFYTLLGLARLEGIGFETPAASRVAGVVAPASESASETGVEWVRDDEPLALGRARREGRPLLIDFWAEWCAACKELDHRTFGDPRVVEIINRDFVALKMDGTRITDEVKAAWRRHRVKGLPAVLFLTPQGEEVARFEAFRSADEVLPMLRRVVREVSR